MDRSYLTKIDFLLILLRIMIFMKLHMIFFFFRENLIALQKKNPEIYSLFNKALSEDEIFTIPVGYYFQNGILIFQQMQTGLVNIKLFYQNVFGHRYFPSLMKILYLVILVLPKLIINFLIISSGHV